MTDIVTRDQCTINPPVTFYIGGGYFFTQYVPVNHYVCSVCGALDIVHTVSTLPISPNAVMGSDHRHRRRFVYVLPGEKPLHSFMEPFRRGWQRLVRQKRSLFVFNHHEPSKELNRTWRRLSHQFLHRRRQSIDSTCSSTSNKSVRFYAIDAIYYTHSSAEYDRTPLCETDDRLAFMSEHLILYADDLDEDEDEEEEEDDEDDHDSFYDEQLILNTNHNRLSSIATSTAHTTVAAMR